MPAAGEHVTTRDRRPEARGQASPRGFDVLAASLFAIAGWALLAGLGRARMFDRDEGFHAMAADLVRHGHRPWSDFLYLHPPGLAWLLAPFGGAPLTLRLVASLFGGLILGLLAGAMSTWYGRRVGVTAAILMATHPVFLTWFGTVKTYPFAGLMTLAALLLLAAETNRPPEARRGARLAASALILGAAVLIRLPAMALAPLGATWLALTDRTGRGLARTLTFLALAVIPPLAAMTGLGASLAQAWYNAIASHAEPVANAWSQRADTLVDLLRTPQIVLCMAIGLAGLLPAIGIRGWEPRRSAPSAALPLSVAGLLTLGYLLARPTYSQYWAFALPFWTWSMAPSLAWIFRRPRGATRIALPLVIGWFGLSLWHADRIVSPYPSQRWFSPGSVAEARRKLSTVTRPGDRVGSLWPGYVAGTGRLPIGGLENSLGFTAAAALSPGERRAFHVLSIGECEEQFRAGDQQAVFLTAEDAERNPGLPGTLTGYSVVWSTDSIVLLVRGK